MGKGRRQPKGSRKQGKGSQPSYEPRQLNTTLKCRRTVRWTTNAAFSGQITFQNIGDILNVVCDVGALAPYQLFDSVVKIHRVSIWGAPGAAGIASTVSCDFNGTTAGVVGDSDRHTAMAIGTTAGPVLHARPAKLSLAAQWQGSGSSAVAFLLTVPTVGSIVELEYSGVNSEAAVSRATQNACAAAIQGATFQRGLDGVALATTKFVSVGFSQN